MLKLNNRVRKFKSCAPKQYPHEASKIFILNLKPANRVFVHKSKAATFGVERKPVVIYITPFE
jgi:hypothetical protein